MDKISTIKKNILYFIENQGFKKEEFFNKIGVSYSNFKGKSLKSEIASDKLVIILTMFPELNAEWLLTGKGEMLKKKEDLHILQEPAEKMQKLAPETKESFKDDLIVFQKEKIHQLQEDLKKCEDEKKMTGNNKNVY